MFYVYMKRIRVCLIRHGQTEYNKLYKIQGSSNIELSDTGIKQAENFQIDKSYIFDIAFHSPLSRSKKTLEIICNKLKNKPNMMELDLITERSYGIFEGLTENEIEICYPDIYKKWKIDENTIINNAESIDDVVNRIKKFLNFLISSNYKNIMIVTHSGYLFALYKFITNTKLGIRPDNIKFPNCCLSILEIEYNNNLINLKLHIDDQTYEYRCCPTETICANT